MKKIELNPSAYRVEGRSRLITVSPRPFTWAITASGIWAAFFWYNITYFTYGNTWWHVAGVLFVSVFPGVLVMFLAMVTLDGTGAQSKRGRQD